LGWTLDETSGALVSLALAITSATCADVVYIVGYRATTDDAECECAAAAHGRPCWHRGLAILCGREVARLYTPTQRTQAARDAHADHAHEAFACAMGYSRVHSSPACGAQPIVREAW